jgi:adenylyl cyclase-associated protein
VSSLSLRLDVTDWFPRDKSHVEFIQAYYRVFNALIAYIKEHFPGGLTWNNKDGVDAMDALQQIQSGAAGAAANNTSAPPPPPPLPMFDSQVGGPPPPQPPPPRANGTSGGGGDMSAVFDQLNQGSAITAGLRKVDKSEMTHKNPSLRASSTVPVRSNSQTSISSSNSRTKSPIPSKKPKPESMRTKKPARKELDGNKWIVENFENTGSEVVEIQAQLTHSILISRCNKCVVKVTGKANAISIDNCTGLSILVESLVSGLDVIKSPKFQVQVDGVVPTVQMDQVDGATVYLGNQSLETELFTSKSTAVNIVLPPKEDADGDGDYKECALPEQIRSVVKNGVIVSEIVDHAG